MRLKKEYEREEEIEWMREARRIDREEKERKGNGIDVKEPRLDKTESEKGEQIRDKGQG